MRLRFWALVPALFSFAIPVHSTTIHVPADQPTIAAGLLAASPGDVVRVAAGTYYENLVMTSGVTLESESGATATVIDGSSAAAVIRCVGSVPSTVIRGFHLTNGTGFPTVDGSFGGAIFCEAGASPVIEENLLSNNTATRGGAIACRNGAVPLIRDNDIHDNVAQLEGGGIFAIDGAGNHLLIEGNQVWNNSATSDAASSGGGIWVGGIDVDLLGNVIHDCSASSGGGGIWAGFIGTKTISGNVVYSNSSADLGGGLWVDQGSSLVENNTFHGNSAPFGGTIATSVNGTKYIRYNLLVSSPQGEGLHCRFAGGVTIVSCNDIWGNAGGNEVCGIDAGSNLRAFPAFCDAPSGDFTLAASSPALPGNNACGVLLGALGPGCQPVSVVPSTWGEVKAHFVSRN